MMESDQGPDRCIHVLWHLQRRTFLARGFLPAGDFYNGRLQEKRVSSKGV
jgi:hypothetical protein